MNLQDSFRGLSEQTRIRIVNLLLLGEMCGCDLQRVLDVPQPYISRHLIYLKRAGLVEDRREGFRVLYRLAQGKREKRLFEFLRQALRDEEVFVRDAQRARQALAGGKLSVSSAKAAGRPARRGEWGAASGL